MAKIQIKFGKYTPFGGLFFMTDQFMRLVMPYVDNYLGQRCRLVGYQYGEILLAMACNFLTLTMRHPSWIFLFFGGRIVTFAPV